MAEAPGELRKGLQQRHLTMIAIGGVIGAGLFVGSGTVIKSAGPGAFITYALTGVLIVMVMRMLGEMATAHPSTGSFSDYARQALGDWAGFSVAWLYWYFWVVVVGFEAVAGAKVIQFWWPEAPLWLLALVLMAAMTATNLFSVRGYGEFEYWFAMIKVAAIVVFLVLGVLFLVGLVGDGGGVSNLTAHGGLFPNGTAAIFGGVVTVVFSMVGAEIATIAAAESHDPKRAIARATNSVVLRIIIFYVGSVFLLACILPWNSDELAASPYVSALDALGIPGVEHVMNAVVLTAVLSCLNSGLYTASRMLFVLAGNREAPVGLLRVSRTGAPARAILFSSLVGFVCVLAAYWYEDTIFAFLLNSSGAVILFVYLLIAVSQLVLRRRTPDAQMAVKMWGFPALTVVTIVAMLVVLLQMGLNPDLRSQLVLSLLAWAVFLACFAVLRLGRRASGPGEATAEQAQRILVLANEALGEDGFRSAVHDLHAPADARFWITVPANPVDTGQAQKEGAAFVWEATNQAAQERLDAMLADLREDGIEADGALGDYRPLVALERSVADFDPDFVLISTHSGDVSSRLHRSVVDAARQRFTDLPIKHVEPAQPVSP